MSKKIKYTDEPMDNVRVITDFLPSPEEFVLKDKTLKVTLSLSQLSVDFFKRLFCLTSFPTVSFIRPKINVRLDAH